MVYVEWNKTTYQVMLVHQIIYFKELGCCLIANKDGVPNKAYADAP